MRIGPETNTRSNELHMQALYESHLQEMHGIKFLREVHVKEVSRIADFLLLQGNTLINVELKTNPSSVLIDQIKDHSYYCDYSFALVPDFCLIPKWFIGRLYNLGIGLIMFNKELEVFTEALPAFYNKGRKGTIKKKYIQIINDRK